MEKVRSWCGQPSHRGRLKNKNKNYFTVVGKHAPTPTAQLATCSTATHNETPRERVNPHIETLRKDIAALLYAVIVSPRLPLP